MNFVIMGRDDVNPNVSRGSKFYPKHIISTLVSSIWVTKYNGYGEFEIEITYDDLFMIDDDYERTGNEWIDWENAHEDMLDNPVGIVNENDIVWNSDSDQLMFVEHVQMIEDAGKPNILRLEGRSLESLLDRRIIWETTRIQGNVQNGIKRLLTENLINPSDTNRSIEDLVFIASTDSRITNKTIDIQFTGTNLYDAVVEICSRFNFGFKITFNQNTHRFEFRLYMGEYRGEWSSEEDEDIIFHKQNDTLLEFSNITNVKNYRNTTLIAGEEQGSSRVTTTLDNTLRGYRRRELYVDARDLQSESAEGNLTPTEYINVLKDRGRSKLKDFEKIDEVEVRVLPREGYVFNENYFLGDEVTVSIYQELSYELRVIEVLESYDSQEGYSVIPKLAVDK